MKKDTRVDAHCHFFNLWYLISELLTMGYDAILGGGYPRGKAVPKSLEAMEFGLDRGMKNQIKDAIDMLIRHLLQMGLSMFNSYEDNYLLLKKNYLAVHGDADDLSVFPLMMDIYYMFDGYFEAARAAGPGVKDIGSKEEEPTPDDEFTEWFSVEEALILDGADRNRRSAFHTYRAMLADPERVELETSLKGLFDALTGQDGSGFRGLAAKGSLAATMTPGFEKEIRDSIALRDKYPETVFPFFAVDPRRAGIVDLVKGKDVFTGKPRDLVSGTGPFYGIKLYPRLGYLPTDERLTGLFEWCAEKEIPIAFHCNTGGFPPLPKWKWWNNSNPAHWDGILKTHKKTHGGLRVDFAHNGDGDEKWRETIDDYATNKNGDYGENVFSDIACYVNAPSLENAKAAYDAGLRSGMRNKLMFGTDFDVMLMTGLVDLQDYFKQYGRIFKDSAERPYSDEMMKQAPRDFLREKGPAGKAATGDANRDLAAPEGERKKKAAGSRLDRGIRLGWLRDPPDVRDFTVFTTRVPSRQLELNATKSVSEMICPLFAASKGAVPAFVDLRPWCSPVEDQKALGSCTANAAVGLVEYFERRVSGRHIDASRLFLYKVTRKLLGWEKDSGAFLRTAMEALVLFGAPPEEYYPYDIESFDEEPASFAYAFAQNYKTINYFRLDPAGTRPEELLLAIKTALSAGYPSVFGFSVYDSMGEARLIGEVPYPAKRDSLRGGHAVMAVGYDDALEICNSAPGSAPTRGALLFRNSWGADWGEEGYGWLPYEYVLSGLAVDWWSIVKQEWVDTRNF